MNSFDMQILNIISDSLSGKAIKNVENWPEVLNELINQAIFCIPYDSIKNGGSLSATELSNYKRLCYQNIAKNMQLLIGQRQMLELFEKNNIPVVILKGSAAAMYYTNPYYRVFGDIDIIVKPDDFDRAFNMLGENYKCIQTLDENPRHAEFSGNTGLIIELHKYFSFGDRADKNEILDRMIFDGINHREIHSIKECKFPCLPNIENGLVLLNHIYQHLQGTGIGYRQIIDFREFIVAEKDCIGNFLIAADKVGLRKLAEMLIFIFMKYTGISIDAASLNVNENAADELLEIIMHSGNFGRKEADDSGKKSETVLLRFKKPLTMISTLQKYGRIHWKASDKYIFLRPFAWLFQIGYYMKQFRKHGGMSALREGQRRVSQRDKLFEELGLD